MKDYLLQHDGRYIECEVDGLRLIYTSSDDPKCHYELVLRDQSSYDKLKARVDEIYKSHNNTSDAYWDIWEFLQSTDRNDFFTDDMCVCHHDLRDIDDIVAYEREAFDKVWLMRSRPVDIPQPNHPSYDTLTEIERRRQAGVERIFKTYDDIPKKGYDDWECGYWNGIMGALRWVMGDEKDFLDT